jgi:phage tail sheath protein FI
MKNVIKFALNPTKAYRDTLYKNNINPIVAFPAEGHVVWGQKTMLSAPSAFDRINVRRLFILCEKAISTAAKWMIFEFNDEYQRNLFRLMVVPFLRRVKGRRGIYDFQVICDATNNPGAVIDANEFVGDIYIKPARSAEFIKLNFISVGTDVNFSEVTIQQIA